MPLPQAKGARAAGARLARPFTAGARAGRHPGLRPPGAAAASGVGVAGLVGLAVGIEREWSGHATGPGARFAGVRTFLLLGVLGGLAGLLTRHGEPAIAIVLLAAGAALTVTAYAVVARRDVPEAADGTTEAAALLVLALGTC